MASALKVWIFFGITFVTCVGTPTTIYDALQPLGCGQFLAILNNCSYEVKQQYRETRRWTVFAPNDTAFNNLPPSRRSALLRMTTAESERFIKSFTLNKELLTSYFRESEPEQSLSTYTSLIFLTKRVRRGGDTASGLIGPTEYYANGAMLLKPNIQAGSSIIHIVDRVLEVPADKTILGYISQQGQADQPDTAYYTQILSRIVGENYDMTVQPLNNNQLRMTVFIPTQDALARIPADKMQILLSNPEKMNKVARQHVIKNEVLYTSFLYHNEGHNAMGEGQIIFRKNMAREAVFVNSGGVTAQIVRGNITCTNGAVHFIDTLLEYVYNTARDEIDITPQTQQFEDLLSQTRTDVEKIFVNPLGVTVFVPINDAFVNLPSFYNLYNNQSLINRVVELSLLEQGTRYPVTTVNGDYAARRTLVSQYYRRPVIIYSQGNETWVESGYVKARVVRPDIAVTNGFVHFIDAVPGAPSRDVPNTIFCEDWLM
ncbi:fasciclin-1-like [Babylonia areolata]|uniref:fasciclin-1-like n=1 Tax=Babylonia areolata TaxID=304850 RepID=UPI003FD08448